MLTALTLFLHQAEPLYLPLIMIHFPVTRQNQVLLDSARDINFFGLCFEPQRSQNVPNCHDSFDVGK